MSQINKMSFTIAELQTALDVYIGLFEKQDEAEIIYNQFHEIFKSIQKSLSSYLIIGCAALFTDPPKTFGAENMSFNNLYKKHEGKFAAQTIALRREIDSIVNKMNLKVFRNKYVGHFGLDENLGQNKIAASITNNELKNLLGKSQKLINMIITDAGLRPKGHSLAYYTEIPEKRSTSVFLNRLYEKKQIQN